jgi:hypothetical protein
MELIQGRELLALLYCYTAKCGVLDSKDILHMHTVSYAVDGIV